MSKPKPMNFRAAFCCGSGKIPILFDNNIRKRKTEKRRAGMDIFFCKYQVFSKIKKERRTGYGTYITCKKEEKVPETAEKRTEALSGTGDSSVSER